MIDNIEARVDAAMMKDIKVAPVNSNRASELGHPCTKYLVLLRTKWQEKKLPDVGLAYIFGGGRKIEEYAKFQLERAGFEVTDQSRAFEDKAHSITGWLDCCISDPEADGDHRRTRYPTEIKGINSFDWEKIHSAEDMMHSKKVWMRKYPAQLQLYLYLSEYERGLFYIVNKLNYRPKAVWMALDYDYVEKLLKKAENVNTHVSEGTLPEGVCDWEVCETCPFQHICLPDIVNQKGVEFVVDGALVDDFTRMQELKPSKAEYDAIDRKLKPLLEGKDKLSIGDYFVTGKYITVKHEAKEASESQQWRKKIVKIKKEGL